MRFAIVFIFFAFQSLLLGEEITRFYHVPPGLESFEYAGWGRIEIEEGSDNLFIFKGVKEAIDLFSIQISDDELLVRPLKRASLSRGMEGPEGRLIVKNLKRVFIKGDVSADIDSLSGDHLLIDMDTLGSSTLEGIVHCKNLAISLKGDIQATLQGRAHSQTLLLQGPVRYNSQNLFSNAASIYLLGSGSAIINTKNSLFAKIKGDGCIDCLGNPKTEKEIDGQGLVTLLSEE